MNINKLTPQMWDVIRTWEYETLIRVSAMMQPLDEDEEF
jgi:hypothetical protein